MPPNCNIPAASRRQRKSTSPSRAHRQTRLALADMLPQVGLQGGYGYMHGLKVGDETVLDGGSFGVMDKINGFLADMLSNGQN